MRFSYRPLRRLGEVRSWLFAPSCAFLAFAVSCPTAGLAADVKVDASISQSAEWDSNPLMRVDHVKELYGTTTTPKLSIARETPASEIRLATWLEHNVFDQEEFDSTDFYGNAKLAKRTQLLEVALGASGQYDTTRTSELTELGLHTDLSRHFGYNLSPSVKYSLSPISAVGLSGTYHKSSYDKENRTDYHTFSISPSYQRNFTERYTGIVAANMRRYETDEGADRVVDSVGPSVGVQAKITQSWSGDLTVGQEAVREKINGSTVQDWSWNSVYAAGLKFKGEQDELRLSSKRAQQSYSNGTDYLLTTVSLDATRRINQLFSVNVGAGYQFSEDEQTTDNRLDSLYSGRAGLTYHFTESIGVTSSYSYKHETFTLRDSAAKQNIVRVGLTYRPRFEELW